MGAGKQEIGPFRDKLFGPFESGDIHVCSLRETSRTSKKYGSAIFHEF